MITQTIGRHALHIAENLSDDEACVRMYGRDEARKLAYQCAITSKLSWIAYAPDGDPVCMFGAFADESGKFGHAWMFSTPNAHRAARSIYQGAAFGIAISRTYWPELRIDAEPRTERQVRFLTKLGFEEFARFERDGLFHVELRA